MEQKLYDAALKLPETELDFSEIQEKPRKKVSNIAWKRAVSVAACLVLLIGLGVGGYAYAAEVKEYNAAVAFFEENGLSTEGLSRSDIKAVYKDITTKSFAYSKTAEVIADSITTDSVGGYEILQNGPAPEDVQRLWDIKNGNYEEDPFKQEGIRYRHYSEYKEDPVLGFDVHDKSFLEKYVGDTLLWSVCITEYWVEGYSIVSDGVIAYGQTDRWSTEQKYYACMTKIDRDGNVIWQRKLDNGFHGEYIAEILENEDGSYAVISRGDYKHFCLSQYTANGNRTAFKQTEVGNYGIWNAARLGDGYIVQLGSYMTNEHAKIVKVDYEGNITESFSYDGADAYYYITDMIEFGGRIYLSAYCVPKLPDESDNAGGRYEIAAILDYLFDNDLWEISSEELTPMVRDHYTAMLLVCDPNGGAPQEFYSVKGSLGGALSVNDEGMLLWDAESITDTDFSPYTSAYTIVGTCYVFRYTFSADGVMVSQEKTGEITSYWR